MTKRHLIIATRKSPLALIQAEEVKKLLELHHPHLKIDLLPLTTNADLRLDISLVEAGGKGLFLKELEEALFDGRADIAVHSMKDVPTELPPGLCIATILKREDARDAFVSNRYASLFELPQGSRVGTSSLRRQTQIRALREDLILEMMRGNVNSRLKRLDENEYAAIILASAGLKRLGFASRIRQYFSLTECLPAAGQGALGIECKEDDEKLKTLLAPLNDANTYHAVISERALCSELDGGCQMPVGAYAQVQHDKIKVRGLVANEKCTRILRAEREGKVSDAEKTGKEVGQILLQLGADKILQAFHGK